MTPIALAVRSGNAPADQPPRVFTQEFTVGRHPSSGIVVANSSISWRRSALLMRIFFLTELRVSFIVSLIIEGAYLIAFLAGDAFLQGEHAPSVITVLG